MDSLFVEKEDSLAVRLYHRLVEEYEEQGEVSAFTFHNWRAHGRATINSDSHRFVVWTDYGVIALFGIKPRRIGFDTGQIEVCWQIPPKDELIRTKLALTC